MSLNKVEREEIISSQMHVIKNSPSVETQALAIQSLASFLQAEAFEKIAGQLERIAAAQVENGLNG